MTKTREESEKGDLEKELGRRIPFAQHLGVRLKEKGGGRAVFELELRPELMNSFNAAHGKGTLVAEGKCVHHGSSVSFCESEVTDTSGRTIARATGTFMLRKEPKG